MREPASPNASNLAVAGVPELLAVSIPDRRRIDSDVRAFLREPSTPWIVFDREGRPPSQLAVGEVLSVALSSVIPEHGFFPPTVILDAPPPSGVSKLEPSSLAVAADLTDVRVDGLGAPPIPMRGLSYRVVGAAALALVCVLSTGALAFRSGRSTVAASSPRSLGSPVPSDVPPPDLDVKPIAPVTSRVTVAVAPPASDESPAKAAAKRFARLSIVGDARARDVFLDGKRLLGRGARNFTVMCGPHSIAIGTKADAHDVDVSCGGELVLGK